MVRILPWRLGSIWWCLLSLIDGQGIFSFIIISTHMWFEVTWDAAPAACQAKWPSDKQYKDFTVGLATIRDDYDNNLIASMMYNKDTDYDVSFGYNQVSHFIWFIDINYHLGCLDWILWRKIKLWKYKIRMEKFRFLNSLHKLGSQRTKCRPFQSWCTDWCFHGACGEILAIRYKNNSPEIFLFGSLQHLSQQLSYHMYAKHFWRNHGQMTIVEHYCHAIVIMDGTLHRRMMTMVIIACEFLPTKSHFMKPIIPVLQFMAVTWFLFTQDRFDPLLRSICSMSYAYHIIQTFK